MDKIIDMNYKAEALIWFQCFDNGRVEFLFEFLKVNFCRTLALAY